MRRASRALLPTILLSTVALAGCGGAVKDSGSASVPVEPSNDTALVLKAPASDGRTGDAVTSMDAGPLRELSRGGVSDPSEPRRGPSRRDGVAAGDTCPDVDLMPAADNVDRVSASTLCLLNGQRADNGLAPLRLSDRLAKAAAGHSTDMVAHSYFAHEGLNGSDIRDRIDATGYLPTAARWTIGENLAWGTGVLATPKSILNAWMNSKGHRENILHTSYREIGLGIVVGNPKRADGAGATYATEFGVRGDDVTRAASTPGSPTPAAPVSTAPASTAPPSTSPAAAKRVKGKVRRSTSSSAKRARARQARAAKARRAKASRAKASRAKAARARAARRR